MNMLAATERTRAYEVRTSNRSFELPAPHVLVSWHLAAKVALTRQMSSLPRQSRGYVNCDGAAFRRLPSMLARWAASAEGMSLRAYLEDRRVPMCPLSD